MEPPHWTIPDGCELIDLDSVGSTNTEALARIPSLPEPADVRLWIVALQQTEGRGRHGRTWNSPRGNLYATRLLGPFAGPADAATLPFVAALAVHDTVAQLVPDDARASLRLKWPNDVLVGTRKVSGILGESEWHDGRTFIAMGMGINLVPTAADRETAALADFGVQAGPEAVFAVLSFQFEAWLRVWADGTGFEAIRTAWLERSNTLGSPATVRLGEERVEGLFAGLDAGGALLLDTGGTAPRRISAGEVLMAGEGT